jgi:hypothetical protein
VPVTLRTRGANGPEQRAMPALAAGTARTIAAAAALVSVVVTSTARARADEKQACVDAYRPRRSTSSSCRPATTFDNAPRMPARA